MSIRPMFFDDEDFWAVEPVHRRREWWPAYSPVPQVERFPSHPFRHLIRSLAHTQKDNAITVDKNKFQANVDVQQFKPEEINVKLGDDNTVIVEGKHEEQPDHHGFISRHFVRKYVLPDDCDLQKLHSKLSSDGVLSICAPRKVEGKQLEGKDVPISLTGPAGKVAVEKPVDTEMKNA